MYVQITKWQDVRYAYVCISGKSRRSRDRIVIGLTTTYAISAYHH